MSQKRKTLPNRRLSEVRKIKMENDQSLYVTLGYDPRVPDAPKEVFYDRGCQSAFKFDPQSARKFDPLIGWFGRGLARVKIV